MTMTWCEFSPIIIGIGAALLGGLIAWFWQATRLKTSSQQLEELQSANVLLKKQLEDAQLHWRQLLEKTTLAQQIATDATNWEEKYKSLLQQFQQQDKSTNTVPDTGNGTMPPQVSVSDWEINYKQIANQYINAKERIRGLETALKYSTNAITESSTTFYSELPATPAIPSYWKREHDKLKESYEQLMKQFQISHQEIDGLETTNQYLEQAYERAKEDSEYRELYEALLIQQRAYEQAIVELEEELMALRDRGI